MSDDEVWKPCPEFDFIEGSSFGRVRTLDRWVADNGGKRPVKGHILKQRLNKFGYVEVMINVNGKRIYRKVHRIIAKCFLSNSNNLPEINHKDCDPSNNRPDNLEWITHMGNMQYRDKYGVSHKEASQAQKKPVYAVNLKTQEVLWIESQQEASRSLNLNQGHINEVLKGKRNHTGGYWFTNDDDHAVDNTESKFGDETARKVNQLINKNILV